MGELELCGPGAGAPLPEAVAPSTQLARELVPEDAVPPDGATEWYPPPRFVLDTDTSWLYIATVSPTRLPASRQSFMPVEQYIEERAQLFVEAFRAAH
jgi:hypothetical protein